MRGSVDDFPAQPGDRIRKPVDLLKPRPGQIRNPGVFPPGFLHLTEKLPDRPGNPAADEQAAGARRHKPQQKNRQTGTPGIAAVLRHSPAGPCKPDQHAHLHQQHQKQRCEHRAENGP